MNGDASAVRVALGRCQSHQPRWPRVRSRKRRSPRASDDTPFIPLQNDREAVRDGYTGVYQTSSEVAHRCRKGRLGPSGYECGNDVAGMPVQVVAGPVVRVVVRGSA